MPNSLSPSHGLHAQCAKLLPPLAPPGFEPIAKDSFPFKFCNKLRKVFFCWAGLLFFFDKVLIKHWLTQFLALLQHYIKDIIVIIFEFTPRSWSVMFLLVMGDAACLSRGPDKMAGTAGFR